MTQDLPANARAAADVARELMRSGKVGRAAELLARMTVLHPANADLLGLLGIAQSKQGLLVEAEQLLRRAVEIGTGATRRRYLNALAALLLGAGRNEDARRDLVRHLTKAVPSPSDEGECAVLCSLASCLLATGDVSRADRLAAVVGKSPLAAQAHCLANAAVLLARLDRGAEARALIERAEACGSPISRDLLLQLGAIAVDRGDRQLRRFIGGRLAHHHPACIERRPSDGRVRVLVLNWLPQFGSADAFACYNSSNTIGAFALGDDRGRFAFDVLLCSDAEAAANARVPEPDLVFNNVATAELPLMTGSLEHLESVARRWDAPVLNAPKAVAATTREENYRRLKDVPGLRFPRIATFSRGGQPDELLADSILLQFGRPVILRRMLGQSGSGVHLCRDRNEVVRTLRELDGFFYAIEYVDCSCRPGLWRKFRVACIGERVIGHKLSFGEDWLVNASGWKRLGEERLDLQAEEERFLADPFSYVGPEVTRALLEVRARTPLEFFGIDFAIDGNGSAVMFEVNAAMRVLPYGRTRSRFPYLDANRERIRRAFEALLIDRAGAQRLKVNPQ